jgi:hypothetical protein
LVRRLALLSRLREWRRLVLRPGSLGRLGYSGVPPDSLAVRSTLIHWPSRSTFSMGTATASSQRSPVKARTMATSPRPGRLELI